MTAPTPVPAPASPTAAPAADEPTHPCVRCGRPVPIHVALCEECNPLELAQPAASQAHGIAIVGVGAAVLVLAIVGRLALAGIGPFESRIDHVAAAAGGLSITVTLTNDGDQAGSATCRIWRIADGATGPNAVVTSPRIDGGRTLSFSRVVTQFGAQVPGPGTFDVRCREP